MPQNQGPFSDYITAPFEPTTPKPTGLESGGGTAAYLASKFLDGLKQHRMQKFALQQQEDDRSRQQFERAIDFVSKRDDLLPEVRNRLMTKLTMPFLQQIAGAKETGKETGNPLTDLVKQVATGMAGGPLPKKRAALDPSVIAESFSEIADPNNTIQAVQSQGEQAIGKILGSLHQTGPLTQEQIETNPDVQKVLSFVRQRTGASDWLPGNMTGSMKYAPVNALDAQNREYQSKQLKFKSAAYEDEPVGTTATPPSTGSTTSSAPGSVGTPGPVDGAPLPDTAPSGNILQTIQRDNMRNKLAGLVEPHQIESTMKQFVRPDGTLFNGYAVQSSKYGIGVIDSKTGQLVKEFRNATANDLNRLPDDIVAKKQQEFEGLLSKSVSPKTYSIFAPMIRANLLSGDEKGAADIVNRAASYEQQDERNQAMRSQAAASLAQSGQMAKAGLMTRIGTQFDNSVPNKNMITADQYQSLASTAIERAKTDPSNVGLADLELLRTWAKMTDIMTGVREGEYRDLQSMIGKFREYGVTWDNLMNSQGARLDDSARKSVMSSINSMRGKVHEQWLSSLSKAREQAQSVGIDPNMVDRPDRFGPPPSARKSGTDAPPSSEGKPVGRVVKPPAPWASGNQNRPKVALPQ